MGKSIKAFLTGQSWHVLKSRGPGTRILTLFCRHTNQSLVLSLEQARENLQINSNGICQFVGWLFKIVKGHAL